jgi:UDP-glucose 4-epimerase
MIDAFRKASKRNIPYQITGRRKGDIAECYADPSLAKRSWVVCIKALMRCAETPGSGSPQPNGYE